MSPTLPRPLRRLVHPRSRRTQLWACVYCGAFEDATPTGESETPQAGD